MIYMGMGRSWGMKHLWGISQAHALSWQTLPAPEFVHLPGYFWDCFCCRAEICNPRWETEWGPPLQLQLIQPHARKLAAEVSTAGRRNLEEAPRTRSAVLRTRLAASRAESPWIIIFLKTCLQFQEYAVFSCCGLAHNVHVQKEIARHRQCSNPDVFYVNKEWRKKVCVLLFSPLL